MPMNWRDNPEAVARLVACDFDELEEAFPGIPRRTLLNRRNEFRKQLDFVPDRNHGSGDTVKTVERNITIAEETDTVPRSLYLKALRERDKAITRAESYIEAIKRKVPEESRAARGIGSVVTPQPRAANEGTVHVVIPDTQAAPGRPTDHLTWIGQYIVDQFYDREDVKIVHLGDHADMPSLSSYDKGKRAMEGRRVVADLDAANEAFEELNEPIVEYNRFKHPTDKWNPKKYITIGNHEFRLVRATEDDPQLDGFLSLDSLNYEDLGWHVQPFLKPLFLDGIGYAHYWSNPMTGKPYGGAALTRLKTLGFSYIQGHQQTLDYAVRFVQGNSQHGLVAGASYLSSEDYKGFQGNAHWRGIVVCHDVRNGSYDPLFVSLSYLCRRYEGMSIERFVKRKYKFDYMGGDAWK